jgi:hypothetical protein
MPRIFTARQNSEMGGIQPGKDCDSLQEPRFVPAEMGGGRMATELDYFFFLPWNCLALGTGEWKESVTLRKAGVSDARKTYLSETDRRRRALLNQKSPRTSESLAIPTARRIVCQPFVQ